MKILLINTVYAIGSTGRIVHELEKRLSLESIDYRVIYGRKFSTRKKNIIKTGNIFSIYSHYITSLLGYHGFGSIISTLILVHKIKKFNPDIIHLHNIHGYFINYKILFNYLIKSKIKVVWTFHDCWPFTGHCIYFNKVNCMKWQTNCINCPQLRSYPEAYFDNTNYIFKIKKKYFSALQNLIIVTPSDWLKNTVKHSFFKNNIILKIHNGINLKFDFNPEYIRLMKKYFRIKNKFLILGVASPWSERKGLDDFIELSKLLDDSISIVLVGKGSEKIPRNLHNITCINHIEDTNQLLSLYYISDVFFNPTYEDNFPTTNLESLACGTPIISYGYGGSNECFSSKYCYTIKSKDYNSLLNLISMIKTLDRSDVRKYLFEYYKINFTADKMVENYINLYKNYYLNNI